MKFWHKTVSRYECEDPKMPSKADAQREIFEAFARAAPFTVVPGTIESPLPPEPDIVCEIEGRGRVGFELTELIDEQYRIRVDRMVNTKNHLNDYWNTRLESQQREIFEHKYRDALICITYIESSSKRLRKRSTESIIQALLSLPDGIDGEIPLSKHVLRDTIVRVYIDRAGIIGPCFDVDAYGRLGDPTHEAITKKFEKTYICDYPLELLAHINTNLLPPEEIWKEAAKDATARLKESQFEKVWVFNRNNGLIEFEA